jgi:hypothetical protein
MKTNSARKNSPTTPEIKLRRVIKLDASQFAIYNTGTIDILNPDGEPIDCIGNTVTLLNSNEAREKFTNNLCLIQELLLSSIDGIQLSEHAVAGLVDTLSRAERMIGN